MKYLNTKKLLNILKNPVTYVLIICFLLNIFIFLKIDRYATFPDTLSYVAVSKNNILKGEINNIRTLGYPYFIKIVRFIGGEEYLFNNIAKIQNIIGVLGIILFYLIQRKITLNKFIQAIFTLIYGISPFIIYWNSAILSETLSIFSILLLIYITIIYIEKPRKILAVILGLYMFWLVMLKPAFIYIIAIYILFWIVRFISNKKEFKYNLIGSISIMISIILLLIYSFGVKLKYNEFGITTVSSVNNVVNVLNSDAYYKTNNEKILKFVEQRFNIYGKTESSCWNIMEEIYSEFSNEEIKDFYTSALKKDFENYIKFIIKKCITISNDSIGTIYTEGIEEYNNLSYLLLPINFAHIYILILAGVIYILYLLIKYKKIDWIFSILICIIGGHTFTTIVGAPFEWQRLFVPVVAVVLMLLSYIANMMITNDRIKLLKNKSEGTNDKVV